MVLIFLSIMNYLIDSYTIFAASVLAGNGIIRSVFGAAFPLFTKQMYDSLGIHWASSVPAFLAVACIPLPFLFYKYGASIRQKCKYAAESEAFMEKMRNKAAARAQQEESAAEGESIDSSRTATLTAEAEDEPRFAEMKTEKETDNPLKKVATGRSTKSRRSVNLAEEFYDNPYEIDRVHTRESFVGRNRANSTKSKRSMK